MKIIVASLPKTGTKSLANALSILGYSVDDVLDQYHRHKTEWETILTKGFTTEQWQKMYENVDAATDAPAFGMWEEIHKAFPDAKVSNITVCYIIIH